MGRKIEDSMEVEPTGDENAEQGRELKYEDKLKFVSAIAQPMAPKKLNKKLMKLIRKAKEEKAYVRFGLKDVQSRIRKGENRGLVVFAGDVTPVDVMCHMPGVCEEKEIPYCYIPSKHDLALAVGFSNSCLMALVKEHPSYKELYDECFQEVKKLGHIM
ncbi:H/ACA ribonucleoprotein complex subunit 2-like protein [Homalodisca vitripennis]|uniref:H/ACA ribonucleoprotein complex subunit 2-like protein n=1 Tax=Homalodisca vitripennis TaxID=197043 RepID=UPI001EE9F5A0|nr:H/ACA ribonucleoprotein complex subunit 2-like protein [Homalodisca vitripennis]